MKNKIFDNVYPFTNSYMKKNSNSYTTHIFPG